jgi:hypothetical protein
LEAFFEHLNNACEATSISYKRAHQLVPGVYRLLKLYPAKNSQYNSVNGLLKNSTTGESFLVSMPSVFKSIPEEFYGIYSDINVEIEQNPDNKKSIRIKIVKP